MNLTSMCPSAFYLFTHQFITMKLCIFHQWNRTQFLQRNACNTGFQATVDLSVCHYQHTLPVIMLPQIVQESTGPVVHHLASFHSSRRIT